MSWGSTGSVDGDVCVVARPPVAVVAVVMAAEKQAEQAAWWRVVGPDGADVCVSTWFLPAVTLVETAVQARR